MIEVTTIPKKGRGVVAKQLLTEGMLIESAPVCSFPPGQWDLIKETDIFQYCFVIPSEYDNQPNANGYLVFGLSSFCNHSEAPNAYIKWTQDEIGWWANLIALTDIQPGEEVSTFYTNIKEYSLASQFV